MTVSKGHDSADPVLDPRLHTLKGISFRLWKWLQCGSGLI